MSIPVGNEGKQAMEEDPRVKAKWAADFKVCKECGRWLSSIRRGVRICAECEQKQKPK
jgi:predicted amidophosphoribosyltransferase